jgi:septum formation protein
VTHTPADTLADRILPPLILASTSPYRRELLQRLGLPFQCEQPGLDEAQLPAEAPRERAARLAQGKALAVAARHPQAVVIGSDQVASIAHGAKRQVLRKPGDRATCRAQLQAMSGEEVHFDTAVAVVHRGQVRLLGDLTAVQFRRLSLPQIDAYMDREPAFDCAGGFKCEGLGVSLFESIRTADPTALIGLPLIGVCAALRELGYAV